MIQVFGGSGFVGSEFVRQNPDCVVTERNDYAVRSRTTEIVYFISTVTNYNVHTDPYIDIETNLTTLMKVLEQCKDKDLTFNFISSWFVYGDTEMPAKEDSYCNPNGFYSITKRCAEQLLISYCQTFNIKYRILRLANVAGPGDKKASPQKNALQHMINELKKGNDVKVYDGGNLYRDYIHVYDAASAIRLVLDKGNVNEIYNIGNGVPLLFKDMIEYAKELIGGPGKLVPIDIPQFHKTVQVKSMWIDNSKLLALGYWPKHDMTTIIEDMIK
jgi:nucleoside-diphosphate-sugar epimerase